MRIRLGLWGVVCFFAAVGASAELQNVDIGGEIRIRMRYWNNVYVGTAGGPQEIRIPNFLLPGRAIGPFGAASRYVWGDDRQDAKFVEQRTRINFNADFTNNVRAFIELESFDLWGEDFRSNYITGQDNRAVTNNDVEMYQGYIEANEMWGMPLRLRIGRQEIKLGKGWLVDDITTAIIGRSWDAVRLTYDDGPIVVDAFYAKLADTSPLEQDGDIDFSGLYATYTLSDALAISGYGLWVRDGRRINDTNFVAPLEWVEDVLNLDDYDPTNMFTVGTRVFGQMSGFDYDWELAYQFGDADSAGALYLPNGGIYGDDGAEFDTWATDLEVGYTFDNVPWSPRVYAGGAYFEGQDNRDLSFFEWVSPFNRPDASVSFNRLFPGKPYSAILEIGQDMSNFWQVRLGATARPTDALTLGLQAAYFAVDESFDEPLSFSLGGWKVPVAPALSFLTSENDDDIGTTVHGWLRYNYSEDLYVQIGWEHLFTGDGLADGNFIYRYGHEFSGGSDDKDADYMYIDTGIKF